MSEHLSWSTAGGAYLNHLLPVPYTEETLDGRRAHVGQAQDALGRRILVENPSSYLRFRHSPIPEPEFLAELADRPGADCSATSTTSSSRPGTCGLDAAAYLDALPRGAVGEIHLAGHARNDADGRTILIDDHGSRVADPVWQLYEQRSAGSAPSPTLIEWDTDVPALDVLLDEATRAPPPRRLGARATHPRAALREAPAGRPAATCSAAAIRGRAWSRCGRTGSPRTRGSPSTATTSSPR